MLLRYGIRNPNRVLQIGLIALAIAGVASYVIQRKSGLTASVVAAASGFVYGAAIGITLLGIVVRGRARRNGRSRA
jgi:phage-related minor tail protein